MTLARIRFAFCSVVAALLAAAWTTAAGQGTPRGPRNVGGVGRLLRRSRSRCRSIPKSPSARCRTACAITCARTPGRRGAPSCGSSSRPARCSKTTTSRGWRTSSSTCSSRARRTFPKQGISEFLASLGLSIGAGRERADELRRHAVHAARADRRARRARSRAARARGLGAGRHVRSGAPSIASAASSSRSGGMHLGAGERTHGQDPARAARGIALRGSVADRQARDHRERAQREQLLRFYRDWYRPDLMAVIVVGDVDRDAVVGDDQAALLVADQPVARSGRGRRSTCRSSPGTRYAIVTDKETTATAVALSDLRPARNQGSVGGYRDIMLDQLFGAHARRPARRAEPAREPAVPPGRRPIAACSRCRGPRTRRCCRRSSPNDGVARGLDALVTELQRVARFGFTATELARAKQAMLLGYERVVDGEPRPRVGEPRRRVHAELPPGRSAADDLAGARVPPPLRARHHAGRGQRAGQPTGSPISNRLVIVSAPETAGVVAARPGAARRGRQDGAEQAARARMSTPAAVSR